MDGYDIKKVQVQVRLNGVNQSQSSEIADASTTLQTCNNFEMLSQGVLSPRIGYAATTLTDGVTADSNQYKTSRFLRYKDRPIVMGPRGIVELMDINLSCEDISQNSPIVPDSLKKPPTLDPELIARINATDTTTTPVYTDCTYLNAAGTIGGVVAVWTVNQSTVTYGGGGACLIATCRVFDVNTGAIVADCRQYKTADFGAAGTPITEFKVAQIGNRSVLFLCNNSGTLYGIYIDISTVANIHAGISATVITNDVDAGSGVNRFDVSYDYAGASNRAYIIFNQASSSGDYMVIYLDNSLSIFASYVIPGMATTFAAGITYVASADELVVVADSAGFATGDEFILDGLTLIPRPYTLDSFIPAATAGNQYRIGLTSEPVFTDRWVYDFTVIYQLGNSSDLTFYRYTSSTPGGLTENIGTGFLSGVQLIGKPSWLTATQQLVGQFQLNQYQGANNFTFNIKEYLVDMSDVCILDTATSPGIDGNLGHCAVISCVGSGSARPRLQIGGTNHMPLVTAVELYSLTSIAKSSTYAPDFSTNPNSGTTLCLFKNRMVSPYLLGSAPFGETSYVSGGSPCVFDGNQILESGFPTRPYITQFATNPGSASGIFNYVAIYQHTDAVGNISWSEASNIFTSSNLVNESLTIRITAPKFSRRNRPWNQVQALLFRTTASGQTYYLAGVGSFGTTAAYVDVVDAYATTAVTVNQKLYYQPGQIGTPLPRQSPPSLRCVIAHKDRLFGIDDQGQIRFTGPSVEGESPWWSDIFQFPVPGGEGFPRALASLQGRLVIFKDRSTHIVDGDGPPENGGNGTEYSPPQLLSGTIGCSEPRSIVITQGGIWFRSARGLEVLTDSFNIEFAGEPIHRTVNANQHCVGVSYCSELDCIKWSFSNTAQPFGGYLLETGIIVCLYVKYGAWTTQSISMDDDTYPSVAFNDIHFARLSGELLSLGCHSDGGVLYEKRLPSNADDAYCDPSTRPVITTLETSWVKFGNAPNTQMRIWDGEIFGLPSANNASTLSLAYNYQDSYIDSISIQPVLSVASPLLIQVRAGSERVYSAKMKAESKAPVDVDGYPFTTGKTPSWLGLAFNVGIKTGQPNIAASNKGPA